jgi:hypothetical protein
LYSILLMNLVIYFGKGFWYYFYNRRYIEKIFIYQEKEVMRLIKLRALEKLSSSVENRKVKNNQENYKKSQTFFNSKATCKPESQNFLDP